MVNTTPKPIQLALVVLCFLPFNELFGQKTQLQESDWAIKLEFSYLLGVGSLDYEGFAVNNSTNVYSLRTSVSKRIRDSSTYLGMGIGLDGYHNPTYNTMPLFIEAVSLHKFRQINFEINLKGGYSIGAIRDVKPGWFSEIALGFILLNKKKRKLVLSPTYKVQQIKNANILIFYFDPMNNVISTEYVEDTIHAHNLGLKLSWYF
ncbi:hypothetical protein [Roseivirga pacifica]|uniref:hypothetical protein n=1 Tax=Roseivirga pacifica TaxID=1267423 RepID=UPI00227B2F8E|nr:hypothetical protein [Roseivirga pacifica]